MAREIELKLEIDLADTAALLASGLLGEDRGETALHAVYFDTPRHELHAYGHSLRIRVAEGKAVQTVKAGGAAAGLFDRGEWELPVVGRLPVADSRTPAADLLAKRLHELVPVFEVPATRRSFRASVDGAEIDVAFDRAEVAAGGRAERFCELELELAGGPGSALFALARRIDEIAPARLSVLSKADHGYRLLAPLPNAEYADEIMLDPATGLPAAFAAIANSCLRHYRLNEAILLRRYVPEAVHQARIALRRLRSAMLLFKAMLAGPERDRLNAGLRALAQAMGEARDLDVLTAEAEPGPMLERLTHPRDGAHSAMNRKLRAKSTRLLMLDLAEWIADGAWRHDIARQGLREVALRDFAVAALDRLRRKVKKHGRHLAELPPEARHHLRKDAKKLRYGVEFLAPLFEGGKPKTFVKTLKRLQDDLGALNDRAAAEQRLAALGLAGTPEVESFLSRWKDGDMLERAAAHRHALLDVKPFWR